MQFGTADTIDFGATFRAGSENDCAAALVETSGGILDLTLSLALYTITFHFFLQNELTPSDARFSVYHGIRKRQSCVKNGKTRYINR